MALKGTVTYKGIAVADTHAVVIRANHDANSYEDADGNRLKKLTASALVRFYKDKATYDAADGFKNYYDQKEIHFTPSVSNAANMNIVKQAYVAMKAMDEYKDMTDV